MVSTKTTSAVFVALLLVTAGGVATAATAGDADGTAAVPIDDRIAQQDEDDEADDDDAVGDANFEVSDLSAVDAAPAGDVVTVTADLTNPAADDAEGFVEFRLDGEVVERRYLALDGDESRTVEFNVNTTDVPPGDYVHGVFTADSGEVAELTLVETAESFTVANLSAPDEATLDEPVTVTADIANDGDETDEQAVDARLDGDVVDRTNVSLDAGENETVEFEVTPEETGTQYLSVFTRDDGEFREITVTAAGDDDDDARDRDDDGADDGDDAEPTANITFENQTSNGSTVTVAEVNTSDGGFVAIHNDSLLDGNVVGSVVGVSEYIEPGEEDDLEVELFDVPGAEFEEDELAENQTLIAMPHLDSNDNETYDFVATNGSADGPYVNDTDDPVVDDAFVTVEADENNDTDDAEPTATVTFENQTSNGSTVTIAEVNTSDGGFVAIHDDSLLDDNAVGSVIGVSEYIEPGEEDDLEVELFDVPGAEFDDDELSENQTLIAMPHLDTNDNETYDFVATQNGEDGPYLNETGEPVVDDAFVTVEDDGIADNVTDNATDEEPVADNATEDGVADNVTDDNATDDGIADNVTDDGVADNVTEDNATDDGVVDNATDDGVADNATGDDAADNATDGIADDEPDGVDDDAADDLPADNATDGVDDAEGNETAGNESDGANDEALIG
ncbi:DUF7282 domain-containing protein [Halostella salina]|uniref:DUF7282 domain-containing protein n=1 Tax=Halostella salina TaxID=1547897 RepID=UPI000EF773E4|nr:CARDB domain-containing protein [Halostella salina]